MSTEQTVHSGINQNIVKCKCLSFFSEYLFDIFLDFFFGFSFSFFVNQQYTKIIHLCRDSVTPVSSFHFVAADVEDFKHSNAKRMEYISSCEDKCLHFGLIVGVLLNVFILIGKLWDFLLFARLNNSWELLLNLLNAAQMIP